ncbi:putative ankyrin, partial [Teratosphaeria destructans]
MTLLSEASDEDDVDLKIANTYLAEARRSANARHHEAAETFYRKFLQRAIELGDRWDGPRIENVRLDLAVACYEQDKLGDAMKLTDALLDHAAEQDEDRERVLTASHLKALILLRQGFLCSALRQCKHSTKIRRRTAGRDLAYYESIALIAFIYELQGDEIDARTYTALLPPGFSRPSFKPPDPSVRPADTTYADSALQVSTISDGVLPGLNCGLDERAMQRESSTMRQEDAGEDLMPERVVNRPDLTPQARRDALKFLETKDISLAKPQDWREQYFRAAETGRRHAVHLLLTDWQYHKTSRFGLKSKEMVNHQKIHVDTTDDQQRTALDLAASNGHADVVQLLLDWGASDTKRMAPDTSSKVVEKSSKAGKTALECAIAKGHRAVVKVFREKNCVHDSVDSNGWSLMHHAASACDTKIVSLLLTQRLDPDRRTTTGRTPLHIAAQHGRQTTLELLLQRRNPEVDAPDHQGHTALS